MSEHPLLDVLTADPLCPVCGYQGTPISDEDGIAYRHEGRDFLCRVTPALLETPKHEEQDTPEVRVYPIASP